MPVKRSPSVCSSSLLLAWLAGGLACAPVGLTAAASRDRDTSSRPGPIASGAVAGVVKDARTAKPIPDAIVVLQCVCMQAQREVQTSAKGIYSFADLPPGNYTLQVLSGRAQVSKIFQLTARAKFRANFSIDPSDDQVIEIVVEAAPVASNPAATMSIGMGEAKQLPVGAGTSRDFSAVVDLAPTGSRDAAGVRSERYAPIQEHGVIKAADAAVSTFSVDVDTASYSNVRRMIEAGQRPPADAVRVEELLNYFSYDYPPPASSSQPFSVTTEVAECPWNPNARLLHIGLQGRVIAANKLPPRNLVFLLDVSGSMSSPAKLPLLQRAMQLLVSTLGPADSVAIVVYAGASGVVLPPTSGADQATIMAALERLHAGGSTNGGAGIELAYALARERFDAGAINRVILATDGDFNVGEVSLAGLQRLIEKQRETGVFLSVLGLGTGNLQDQTMEMLADKGNGNYAYLDSLAEARKVLVDEAGGTLVTIAKDVKIQVELDPAQVSSYRLIGYENRALAAKDFADDRKDAGEIGAGHSVTALYEFVPAAGKKNTRKQAEQGAKRDLTLGELRLRHKQPDGDASKLLSVALSDHGSSLAASSDDFRFAAAVAQFGMLLRESRHRNTASWAGLAQLAAGALGPDLGGHRRAFLDLVARAEKLR